MFMLDKNKRVPKSRSNFGWEEGDIGLKIILVTQVL